MIISANILIADDHPLLLKGTQDFLGKNLHKVVATASDGNSAYNKIVMYKPEIAILDFDMPILNGLEVAKNIKIKEIPTKIIILTLYKQEAILNEVGQLIEGYITKDSALEELQICIDELLQNKTYVSPKIRETTLLKSTPEIIQRLTATEIKILKQLAKNLSSAEIADLLFISKRTVEKHRSNIIKKLEIKGKQNALFVWLKDNQSIFDTP